MATFKNFLFVTFDKDFLCEIPILMVPLGLIIDYFKGFFVNIFQYFLEYNRYLNIVGVLVILGIAYCFSHNRARIQKKIIMSAGLLHLILSFFVLKTAIGQAIISSIAGIIASLYHAADGGIQFVFGALGAPTAPWGFIFAFHVLPIIIFFGAFMALLFHIGLVQKFVGAINYGLQPLLGTSGAETLCAIANSFLGQTEAPLLIRHYIKNMTKSEIFVVMVSGMGTISGALLAVYAVMGVPAQFLLSSSVMAIPATILIAKIMYPETEKPETLGKAHIKHEEISEAPSNILGAISAGTSDGLMLALNVGAMLIAFIALIGMINSLLGFSCEKINLFFSLLGTFSIPCLTLQDIFGYMFAPFGYLLGLTGTEIFKAGQLLGLKVAVNEMVAFSNMLKMNLSHRAIALLTFALCGFSNFSCIGIQIGGIGVLAPNKRGVLSELGLRAVFAATLANLLSAMVAGLLL